MYDRLISLREALTAFASATATQSQEHIQPLHEYVALRLVLEGGFHPDDISPHPPLRAERTRGSQSPAHVLEYDETAAHRGEQTILGGLKTKDVDVVVAKQQIGPCVAVSLKGTLGAFRNLTNRMEEAVGDCTNLHISYPALVYGFLHVMRANVAQAGVSSNDAAISNGAVVDSIRRYHDALARITHRRDLRNEVSRYEAVAIALVSPPGPDAGSILPDYPAAGSPLAFGEFFAKLYAAYDLRFVYSAPLLERKTQRLEWIVEPELAEVIASKGFVVRTA